jgi:hypothetical protein
MICMYYVFIERGRDREIDRQILAISSVSPQRNINMYILYFIYYIILIYIYVYIYIYIILITNPRTDMSVCGFDTPYSPTL